MAFDADSGRLDVAPDAPAYGTKLRWSEHQLLTAVRAQAPDADVRSLRVLPPAVVKAGPAAAAADTPAQPDAPATRRAPSEGYRQALAAHQAAKTEQGDRLAPAARAAIERQDQELRARREPEDRFGDGQTALEELRAKANRSTSPDSARARALQRARRS